MDDPEREAARRRLAQDLQDYNNETAGREVGRIRRFLPEQLTATRRQREEREDQILWSSVLGLQQRIEELRERLDALDRASLRALEDAERKAEAAAMQLEQLRLSANRDAEGRLVYRTRDGLLAFYEDGRRLTQGEIERVEWRENAPCWEERKQREEEYQREVREVMRIASFRDHVDSARERLNSGEALSEKELSELEKSVADLPESIGRELSLGAAMSETRRLSDDDILAPLSAAEEAELASYTGGPAWPKPGPKTGR